MCTPVSCVLLHGDSSSDGTAWQSLTCVYLHLLPVPQTIKAQETQPGSAQSTSSLLSAARFSQCWEQGPGETWEQLTVKSAFPEDLFLSKAAALKPEQVSVTPKSHGSYSM